MSKKTKNSALLYIRKQGHAFAEDVARHINCDSLSKIEIETDGATTEGLLQSLREADLALLNEAIEEVDEEFDSFDDYDDDDDADLECEED